ncbi:tail completion protein gp17 [Tepidimicrobium xylanilyticum]
MEIALRNLIENNIEELQNEIYPTNAPEGATRPYLVYTRINTKKVKTLQGMTNKEYLSYMFSIMATRYGEMKKLTKQVEDLLISLPGQKIGNFYIEDIDINNVHEVFEYELQVNRGIIDFTIYFEEVE